MSHILAVIIGMFLMKIRHLIDNYDYRKEAYDAGYHDGYQDGFVDSQNGIKRKY